MNIINIKHEINKNDAISAEDGKLIFEKIKSFIDTQQEVMVDFEGIDLVLSTFLNPAIGQLYYLYEKNVVNTFFHYRNLVDVDEQTLDRVIQNALNQKENKPSINKGLIDG